jgi:hypothetical protein
MTLWWVGLVVLACVGVGVWAYTRPKRLEQRKEQVLSDWTSAYDAWLTEFQIVMGKFPDQASMEGMQYGEVEAKIINEINDLYVDEAYHLTTRLVLKGASLRNHVKARKS